MIIFKTGNIFESECDCIINPVNSVGVMGAGLAQQFMSRYPTPCRDWNKIYEPSLLQLPKFYAGESWNSDKDIIMFPTKIHYRNPSELDFIEKSIVRTLWLIRDHDIKSLAIPAVGAGLGGLNWNDVKELIEHHFTKEIMKDIGLKTLEVYEP